MNAAFDRLSLGVRREILMNAVRAGAEPITEATSDKAPRLTGALSRRMMFRIFESSAAEVTARIGPEKSTFYGRYSEQGTKFEREKPWLRPAFDENRDKAFALIGEKLWSGIQKELA